MVDAIVAQEKELRRFLTAFTRDTNLIDDLVQDTMIKAIENQHKLTGDVGQWMRTVARRLFIDNYRSKQRIASKTSPVVDVDVADVSDYTEVFRNIREVLPKLRPMQRRIVAAGLRGETRREIEQRVGRQACEVRRQLRKAREIIQDAVRG